MHTTRHVPGISSRCHREEASCCQWITLTTAALHTFLNVQCASELYLPPDRPGTLVRSSGPRYVCRGRRRRAAPAEHEQHVHKPARLRRKLRFREHQGELYCVSGLVCEKFVASSFPSPPRALRTKETGPQVHIQCNVCCG